MKKCDARNGCLSPTDPQLSPPTMSALLTETRDRLNSTCTLVALVESWANAMSQSTAEPCPESLQGLAGLCSRIRQEIETSEQLLQRL